MTAREQALDDGRTITEPSPSVEDATVGGCIITPNVVMCSPRGLLGWRIGYCPNCDRRRKMFVRFAMWYGEDTTCLTCGDAWQDGEMLVRPFERGWRKARVEAAKRNLHRALPPRQYRAAVREFVRAELAAIREDDNGE